jgi:hypothetical protein
MESDNYSYDASGTGKFLKVTGDTMNVIIAANFDMNSLASFVCFITNTCGATSASTLLI